MDQRKSFTHADDLVGGQGAGTHATLMTAAVDQWLDADLGAAANIQYANAFGSVCLVAGERHQVDAQAFYIEIQTAYTLGSIDMQGRTAGKIGRASCRARVET